MIGCLPWFGTCAPGSTDSSCSAAPQTSPSRSAVPTESSDVPLTDLSLDELVGYRPTVAQPADFDAFWARTLSESRSAATAPDLLPATTPVTELVVEDLRFSGFGGERVAGWVTRPRGGGPRPAVIEYVGYNGGRGLPGERVLWALAGLRACRHGHARTGQRLGHRRRHARPARLGSRIRRAS